MLYVSAQGQGCAHVACVVSSICPLYFSSSATLNLPSTTLTDPYSSGTSRPVKWLSY